MKNRMISWLARMTLINFKCIAFVSTIIYYTLERMCRFQDFIQEMVRYGEDSEFICKDRTGC